VIDKKLSFYKKVEDKFMARKKYDDWERYDYENMVVELACGMETMDEDEYQEKFDSLPEEYQEQVRANELEFADGAVGDKSWRSDW
jgi:cobalamin biosynthesis Mg chelatase CobN